MTGRELIDALLALKASDLGLEVETEGCDCTGQVRQVRIDMGVIYLARYAE